MGLLRGLLGVERAEFPQIEVESRVADDSGGTVQQILEHRRARQFDFNTSFLLHRGVHHQVIGAVTFGGYFPHHHCGVG